MPIALDDNRIGGAAFVFDEMDSLIYTVGICSFWNKNYSGNKKNKNQQE